jgi:curved DNA-binding protein CbpA
MSSDYYEMLRITPAASFDEVHKAYRLLAMQFIPTGTPLLKPHRR